ncbi:MAG: hypothetical protein E7438_06090 [Ruminococcaceae bacterium]|nr:hypothetical protein [Oscillospiraceae bacterium]
MKKYWFYLLAALMLLLSGCGAKNYSADTFYSAELLTEYDLEGLPAPKLENSRLDGDYLYCNLTQEEYEDYVAQVMTYLQDREDVQHVCYLYDSTMMFGFFPQQTFAPVTENYSLSGNHRFACVTDQTLSKDSALEPYRICIYRESGTLSRADFSYNTYIQLIADAVIGDVDPCAAAHRLDEGANYPCPGQEDITVYRCVYCSAVDLSQKPDYGYYDVTVSQGRNYILSNSYSAPAAWDITSLSAGTLLEITVRRATTGETAMTVNGQSIPALREDANTVTFGFVMPEADIDIQFVTVPQE